MIVKENIEISGRVFVKTYPDGGFYIERDGEKYSEAIDPSEFGRIQASMVSSFTPNERMALA